MKAISFYDDYNKHFKAFLVFLLVFFLYLPTYSQTYFSLAREGIDYYYEGKYKESNQKFLKAFKYGYLRDEDIYLYSSTLALLGDYEKAFKMLNKAIKKGWTDLDFIENDTTFTDIKHLDKWERILRKIKRKRTQAEKKLDKELVSNLTEIRHNDQLYRKQWQEVSKKYGVNSKEVMQLDSAQAYMDSLNLIKVVDIIKNYGYPSEKKAGKSNHAVFLVIQHANLSIQKKYLPLLTKAAEKGELNWSSLALLIDRINIREDKEQIYGTQLKIIDSNKFELYPIHDEKNVNNRRLSIGMPPLEEYVKRFGIDYKLPVENK